MDNKFAKCWIIWIHLIVAILILPLPCLAQGTQPESFSIAANDQLVESWLGRENRIQHPVVKGLQAREAATLHFYFSRTYGQRAESVIASAESARSKTLRFFPPETVEDIHVYLLGNINQYFDALDSKGRAPEWAAGLTILRDGVILIRLSSHGTSPIEPERTLAHEINHVALRRFAQENQFPHWFYEGLAMTATDDWNINRAESLGKASMAGQLLDLDEIDEAFGKTGSIVDLAYAESAHFVSWMTKTYGDEKIKQLIQKTATGTKFEQSFTDVYGRSPKAAFKIWHDNMSRGESLLASIFSHDGLFFMISVFAAIALSIALWRRMAIRKRRMAAMNQGIPESALPDNLKNFGPFRAK